MHLIVRIAFVLASFVLLVESGSTGRSLANEQDRLRQMYRNSERFAAESLYELSVLKHLRDVMRKTQELKHGGVPMGEEGKPEITDNLMTIHRDTKNGESKYQLSTDLSQSAPTNSANATSTGKKILDEIIVRETSGVHNSTRDGLKSNARQSALFSGFRLPTTPSFANPLVTSNPLMNNLMHPPALPTLGSLPTFPALPTLSTFPTLPAAPIQPPKPPKTSIIGNNGGPMALTNDNVVVVNVLSGNY